MKIFLSIFLLVSFAACSSPRVENEPIPTDDMEVVQTTVEPEMDVVVEVETEPGILCKDGDNEYEGDANLEQSISKVEPIDSTGGVTSYEFTDYGLRFSLDSGYYVFDYFRGLLGASLIFDNTDEVACLRVFGDGSNSGIYITDDSTLKEAMKGALAEAEYSDGNVETIELGGRSFEHVTYKSFGGTVVHEYFIQVNERVYEVNALEPGQGSGESTVQIVEDMLKTVEFF